MFPVRQKVMVKRSVRFKDARLDKATVFPMFDARGRVRRLVVVDHLQHQVYHLVWRQRLVSLSWLGGIRFHRNLKGLPLIDADEAYRMTDLWHFDPWWLLKEPPFDEHPATPGLKDTNCIDHLSGAESLYFARDLSKVAVVYRSQGEALEVIRLEQGVLPERASLRAPSESKEQPEQGGWRLRPFWARASRSL